MCRKIETDVVRSRESEEKFLIHVYDQMFATINRIHYSIWNMAVAVGGGVGILKLYFECYCNCILNFAIFGYLIVLSWILTRLVDFNYWCNRNLFIIHKIEDRFLGLTSDHIYGNFRPPTAESTNTIKTTIFIQIVFVGTIQIGTLLFYLYCNSYVIGTTQYITTADEGFYLYCKSYFICTHTFLGMLFVLVLLALISFFPACYVFKLRNKIYKNKTNQK